MAEPKPFHEAIVDVVNALEVSGPDPRIKEGKLLSLMELTTLCAIPKNHDAIANAFMAKMCELWPSEGEKQFGLRPGKLNHHLASEKAKAEKKAADMSIDNVQSGPTGLLAIANR